MYRHKNIYIKHTALSVPNQPRWKRENFNIRSIMFIWISRLCSVCIWYECCVFTTFMVNGKTFPIFGWVLCNWRMKKFNSSSSSILAVTTCSLFSSFSLAVVSLIARTLFIYLFERINLWLRLWRAYCSFDHILVLKVFHSILKLELLAIPNHSYAVYAAAAKQKPVASIRCPMLTVLNNYEKQWVLNRLIFLLTTKFAGLNFTVNSAVQWHFIQKNVT